MATKPAPPVKKLVVLEESALISMANQQQFLREFPFLRKIKDLATRTSGCGGCGGGRARSAQRSNAVSDIKSTLVSMGDDRKRKLKKMLNTAKARVTIKQGTKIVQHTF